MIYNKIIPDLVISPFFVEYKNTKKIKNTALIVRKEFLNQANQIELSTKEKKLKDALNLPKKHHVLIIPSGVASVNPKAQLKQDKINYDVSIIGSHNLMSKNIKKYNKTFNTSLLIKQSTIVVINGGLSSISEALAMETPMIVIPIKGHLEQKINCLIAGKDKTVYKSEKTKEELWEKYYIQAPAQRRQPVKRYKIVRRA